MRKLRWAVVLGGLLLAGCKENDAAMDGRPSQAIGSQTMPSGLAGSEGFDDAAPLTGDFAAAPSARPAFRNAAALPAPAQIGARGDEVADGSLEAPKLAYSHQLSIGLAPLLVKGKFEALRDACVSVAALKCTLADARLVSGGGNVLPAARIRARLPHDTVGDFKMEALKRPPGPASEGQWAPRILEDSTSMEDLGRAVADVDRRLNSLKTYRDRLDQIAARPDSKVEDLIRVADEISQVQARIEDLTSRQGQYERRVATEIVTVLYQAESVPEGRASPILEAWRKSGDILARNTADVMIFLLEILPWVPVWALGVVIVVGLIRLAKRLKGARRTPPVAANVGNGSGA